MSIQISVVVPTRNRSSLITRCVKALLNQTASADSYELIIVMDGPDATTEQALLELTGETCRPVKLQLLGLPFQRGPAAARNAGWKRASGDLILFTDDDCIPSENLIEQYLHSIINQPVPAIALKGKVVVPIPAKPTDYQKNIAQLQNASFITANCVISKKALKITGGFDEAFTMPWREDAAMEFALIKNKIPIVTVKDAVVVHPVRQARWGISLFTEKKNMYNALLYKKFSTLYRERINEKPPVLYYGSLISLAGMIAAQPISLPAAYSFLFCWVVLTVVLICQRLRGTSRQPAHVTEMIITSFFIPMLSLYWNLYGCIRFKSILL